MRVPTYDRPRVEPAPLPAFRQDGGAVRTLATAGQSQAALAQGAFAGGGEISDIALKMQDRQNADMIFRADSALKDEYLSYENQARQRRGQNAWGLTEDTNRWWEDAVRRHGGNLENNVQRRLFEQQAAKMRRLSVDTLSGYEADQRRASLEESTQASIVSSINLAAANSTNIEAVQAAKGDVLKRTQVLADINGWSPELKEAKQSEYLSNFHKQVLGNLVESNPNNAKIYYEANKGEIAGSQHATIEKALKEGTLRTIAQQAADAVEVAGLSEQEALTQARKQFEGDEEAAVVQEIKTRFGEQSTARERDQREAADEAFGIYARTGRLSAVPAGLLSRMDGRSLLALKKDAQSAAEGKEPKTNWDTYYELRQQAVNNPDAFKSVDLRQYFPALGRTEREGLIDLQTKVLDPDKLRSVRSLDSQINATIAPLGLKTPEKAQAEDSIRAVIETEQKRLGKELTADERQKIIDRQLMGGEVLSGAWYRPDPDKRYYELTPVEKSRFKASIPKEQMAQIVEALRAKGKPVTDENIIDLYQATKRRGLLE